MKKYFIALIFFLFINLVYAQSSELMSYIGELKNDPELKNSLFSIKVVNSVSKKTIIAHQPNVRLVPASVQKLVTTGTGFVVLSKDHRFTTRLAYSGQQVDSCLQGSLYIIGGGDPTLGSDSFPETNTDSLFKFFLKSLRRAGIKSITGDIIANDSYFDSEKVHQSWEWEDLGFSYGTGTSGLSFAENAFTMQVSANNLNDSVQLSYTYPYYVPSQISNEIKIVSKDSLPKIQVNSSPLIDQYLLSGQLPFTGKQVKIEAAMQNPVEIFVGMLTEYLKNNGITISGVSEVRHLEPDQNLKEISVWYSPTYDRIAANTNAYSNNMFADMILKHIGKNRGDKTDFRSSVEEMKKMLKTFKLPVDQVRWIDGSGLSRQNLMSVNFLCQFLAAMEKRSPHFMESLPMPGQRGTLLNFMNAYNETNRKQVHLKSGSMSGVLCYAGYVRNKNDEIQYVAIMINNFICKPFVLRRKVEKLIYLLTQY